MPIAYAEEFQTHFIETGSYSMKMVFLFSFLMTLSVSDPNMIYIFRKEKDSSDWYIVDDVVMGGRSAGSMTINSEGHGHFHGRVSPEYNGGFSSVRHDVQAFSPGDAKTFVLRIKGDGKKYQFRVKKSEREYHSYAFNFQTSGQWEEIRIPFNKMYPTFRGRTLDYPNYDGELLVEIGFLIANKKAESFDLLIDYIATV